MPSGTRLFRSLRLCARVKCVCCADAIPVNVTVGAAALDQGADPEVQSRSKKLRPVAARDGNFRNVIR